jgi:ketosteroid isomerase-like protein
MFDFRFRRALFCLLLAASALGASGQTPPQAAVVEKQIRQSLADWMEATNHRRYDRANEVWAPGVVGWFPEAPAFSMDEAYRVAGVAKGSEKPYGTYELTIDEILVGGELAVVRDVWRETIHFPGTDATAARPIKSFEVWKPQPDGKWRITRWISAPEPWQSAGTK